MEIWKDIPEYEGLYQVSNLGRVKSLAKIVQSDLIVDGVKHGRSYAISDRIRKTPVGLNGYPHLSLRKDGKSKTHTVHTLVTAAFLGPTPEGQEVRHRDGDRSHCDLSNLCFGTPKQNGEDRVDHGTSNAGETNGMAVLTDEDVRKMRRLFKSGAYSGRAIGRLFGISPGYANAVIHGRRWKHVV